MHIDLHPDLPDFATVRRAFEALEPTDPARWGTMDAPRMAEHCARFNELYLGRVPVGVVTRVLARLLGGFFVKRFLSASPYEMKKGMTTMPALRTEEGEVDEEGFREARARVLATLSEIEAISGTWDHPLYGSIDAEVGKALVRHHSAHHLHQFGRLPEREG